MTKKTHKHCGDGYIKEDLSDIRPEGKAALENAKGFTRAVGGYARF